MTTKKKLATRPKAPLTGYASMLSTVTALLESARRASVRAVNVVMTATYWEIGRRIVIKLDRQLSTLFLRKLAETRGY